MTGIPRPCGRPRLPRPRNLSAPPLKKRIGVCAGTGPAGPGGAAGGSRAAGCLRRQPARPDGSCPGIGLRRSVPLFVPPGNAAIRVMAGPTGRPCPEAGKRFCSRARRTAGSLTRITNDKAGRTASDPFRQCARRLAYGIPASPQATRGCRVFRGASACRCRKNQLIVKDCLSTLPCEPP